MHGLINRSIQCFIRDTYGRDAWVKIAGQAELGFENFEALVMYDDDVTEAILNAASERLANSREMLLEDLGTYLVSHPNLSALRRLLRFGGDGFVDFLHSLDELYDRARLAVPDLTMPMLELRDHSATDYSLLVLHEAPGFGHVMVGVLRAMADDYGALALLEHQGRKDVTETIQIELLEVCFSEGRDFTLSARLAEGAM